MAKRGKDQKGEQPAGAFLDRGAPPTAPEVPGLTVGDVEPAIVALNVSTTGW